MDRERLARLLAESIERRATYYQIGAAPEGDFYLPLGEDFFLDLLAVADDVLAAMREAGTVTSPKGSSK